MPDMFDPSPQPNMAPDPTFAATQAVNYQIGTNALLQQQQAMLNATQASVTPGYYNPGVGMMPAYSPTTLQIASAQLSQGMSNLVQGTMMASGQLMQNFSGMGQSAHRFVVGSKYNDIYMGPNSYALESSVRRELGSAMGFDHHTSIGRLLLGGFRPDFMTDKEFKGQMDASLQSRFSTAGMTNFGISSAATIAGLAGGSFLGGVIAAPIGAVVSRAITSTEHMYVGKEQAEDWQKYANLRVGFGAQGFMDKKTVYDVRESMSAVDAPTWSARFLGKNLSRKFGLSPEIQQGDVRNQMEELGMFSIRAGSYDAGQITESVKSITNSMKELAGIARVLKEEIPKAAAQLQQAGGFTFNQSGQYMGLLKQAVNTAGVTGIDLNRIVGAQSDMMRVGAQNGFGAMGTGTSVLDTINQVSALKAAGMISQNIDPTQFSQTMQMGMMQNQRNNIFAQMKPGETPDQFRNRVGSNPGEFFTNKYQTQGGGDAMSRNLDTLKNMLDAFSKNPAAVEKMGGKRNMAMMLAERVLPNGTMEEQKTLVDMLFVGKERMQNLADIEQVRGQYRSGVLEQKLRAAGYGSEAGNKARALFDEANQAGGGSIADLAGSVTSSRAMDWKDAERRDEIFKEFGGIESLRNRDNNQHYKYARSQSSWMIRSDLSWLKGDALDNLSIPWNRIKKTEDFNLFMQEEMKRNGGNATAAEATYKRYLGMTDSEYDEARKHGDEGRFGAKGKVASAIAAQIQNDVSGGMDVGEALNLAKQNKGIADLSAEEKSTFVGNVISEYKMADTLYSVAGAGSNTEKGRVLRLVSAMGGDQNLNNFLNNTTAGYSKGGVDQSLWTTKDLDNANIGPKLRAFMTSAIGGKMTIEEKLKNVNDAGIIDEAYNSLSNYNTETGGRFKSKEEIKMDLTRESGVARDIKTLQDNFYLSHGSDADKAKVITAQLAGKDGQYLNWAKGVVDKAGKGGYEAYSKKYGKKIRDDFMAAYNEELALEKEGKAQAGGAFGRAQARVVQAVHNHLMTDATGDEDKVISKFAKEARSMQGKWGDSVGRAVTTLLGDSARSEGFENLAEDKRKALVGMYRDLTTTYKMSDEKIRQDMNSLYGKDNKYGQFILDRSKTFEGKDEDRKGFTDFLRGNQTLMNTLRMSSITEKDSLIKKISSGASLGNDEIASVRGALQNVNVEKLQGLDSANIDLYDKRASAEAIGKLNELLGMINTKLNGNGGKPTEVKPVTTNFAGRPADSKGTTPSGPKMAQSHNTPITMAQSH